MSIDIFWYKSAACGQHYKSTTLDASIESIIDTLSNENDISNVLKSQHWALLTIGEERVLISKQER